MENATGVVTAVCLSEKRGTEKTLQESVELIEDFGIKGDAHAGKWHRQVSLLSQDKVDAFNALGAGVESGAFGENILVKGLDFRTFPIGTRFKCNDVVLEMTQIGKECHTNCDIFKRMGTCIMPHEGVFTRVIHGGNIKIGDTFEMIGTAE
ncbi:MAG: MOSC domain-containing protein [Clostridia bacterium]|nr:MOSC domain-containing protein [Clostridia bacterium]